MTVDFVPNQNLVDATALSPVWIGLLQEDSVRSLCNHPLLVAFAKGDADLETLRELLAQHHLYSRFFTRFLCALISNLPEIEDVRILSQNLVEELGAERQGDVSHAELFLRSMGAVGVTPHSRPPMRATEELTASMFRYCRSPDPLEGLAALCLGAEAIVPLIYYPVIEAMKSLGVSGEGRRFFELHVAEDEGHALAMLRIMIRLIGDDRRIEERVRNIGADMIARRIRFLDQIWAGRRPETAFSR